MANPFSRMLRVVDNQLAGNIHALDTSGPFALVVGLVGLLWGAQGVSQAGQYAMGEVWNIPTDTRPFARDRSPARRGARGLGPCQ